MIMPQWMETYTERTTISHFKIAFRTHPESVAMPILEAYMNKYHGGNYCDMWPTVAQLGHTSEPTERTYISTKKLDEYKFLDHWKYVDECSELECGEECSYCYHMYDKVSR